MFFFSFFVFWTFFRLFFHVDSGLRLPKSGDGVCFLCRFFHDDDVIFGKSVVAHGKCRSEVVYSCYIVLINCDHIRVLKHVYVFFWQVKVRHGRIPQALKISRL